MVNDLRGVTDRMKVKTPADSRQSKSSMMVRLGASTSLEGPSPPLSRKFIDTKQARFGKSKSRLHDASATRMERVLQKMTDTKETLENNGSPR